MPDIADIEGMAQEYGFTIDDVVECPIQGVLIEYSRPRARGGETLLGLPVAGERQTSEVIERHFCPGDADDATAAVTLSRACQHVMWQIEAHGRITKPAGREADR